ncbi:MAG: shikimate kinase [Spirochaetales bacterium]|nr:shikimate kinase [Spirochaetales bacterium]
MEDRKTNIVLTGMPGAGKSTLGVLLAKVLGFSFCDTDLIIQQREKSRLQSIIDTHGITYFLEKEKEIILSLDLQHHVIAPGGSVVYHEESMNHLKKTGHIIYLEVPPSELIKRITNITTRGIAMAKNQTFEDIYTERLPLYTLYAEKTILCKNKHIEEIIEEISLLYKNR